MLKKDDIFIDWSSWSVVGSIVLSKLCFECGLSSNQTRTNDVRNVVLLMDFPRAYTITSFSLTNAITVFTWRWKSSDMEIPMSCCWAHQQHFVSPMIHVEHQPSAGNFVSNAFVFHYEAYAWMEEVTSSNSCALGVSCRHEFEKGLFCFLWNHPKLVMHVQSILWFDRLATSSP